MLTQLVLARKISQLEWFAFLLFARMGVFSSILLGRALFQEFLVEIYICIESSRLNWIKMHQKQLHVQLYHGIVEALGNKESHGGAKIVLPSSFIGGPQAMAQL